MGATATLRDAVLAVDPGSQATTEIRVRNDGAVVDQFTLDVVGEPAAWAVVEPSTLSLFPGAEEVARVVFQPPRNSATPHGSQPFGVRVRSREDPAGSTVEEGSLEVGAFIEPFAELVPRTSRGSRTGTHEVAIDNRGNARLNAEVTAADPDQLLGFDIEPPGIVVEPGTASFAKVRVKPRQTFLRGTPKSRPFNLVIQPAGGSPISLDGTLLQESVLPPWFMRALIGLVGLLIALVLFWILVLRPSIESAASQAVEAPIAELRDGVNGALAAGGLPTMGPGAGGGGPTPTPVAPTPTPAPGETPSATVAPTAPPPLIPGLGNPIDGRLDRTAQVFTATSSVFITDLIFGNPNGRFGSILLRREGTTLMTLRLENFRDLDFHFVTPIVLNAGQSLVIDLSCEGVSSAAECDPSLFYSGYQRPSG
jgi:hypothetical protein